MTKKQKILKSGRTEKACMEEIACALARMANEGEGIKSLGVELSCGDERVMQAIAKAKTGIANINYIFSQSFFKAEFENILGKYELTFRRYD